MNTTNRIHAACTEHFAKGDNRRVVFAAPGARSQIVLTAAEFAKVKPEGSGLRFGKLFIFEAQVRFARTA